MRTGSIGMNRHDPFSPLTNPRDMFSKIELTFEMELPPEIAEKVLSKIQKAMHDAMSDEVRTDVPPDTLINLLTKEVREMRAVPIEAGYDRDSTHGMPEMKVRIKTY